MGGWDVARDLEVVVAVVDGAVVVVEDVVAGCEGIEGGGVPDLDAGGGVHAVGLVFVGVAVAAVARLAARHVLILKQKKRVKYEKNPKIQMR
jgi:hypothetical protein